MKHYLYWNWYFSRVTLGIYASNPDQAWQTLRASFPDVTSFAGRIYEDGKCICHSHPDTIQTHLPFCPLYVRPVEPDDGIEEVAGINPPIADGSMARPLSIQEIRAMAK